MVYLVIILGIIITFLIMQCLHWNDEGKTYGFGISCGWTLVGLFVIEIICISESISKPHPKAMDVYQGKTTLDYTIRDGEIIDSVVVFKNNVYGNKD